MNCFIKSNFFESIKNKLERIDVIGLRDLFRELAEEHENLKTVFNSMAEGVLVIDIDENILFYNKMSCKIFQITPGLEKSNLINAINNQKIYDIIQKMLNKNDRIITEEMKLDDETFKYLSLSIHPLVKKGKIIGNILISEDITEKKESENKLKQMESIQALTSLTAGLAHEIKNPLGAIGIHVQLLDQEIRHCQCDTVEDLRYSLKIINEEIERLNEIVVNFLYSVRPLKAELQPIDFCEYLDKIGNFIQPELKQKQICLVKKYSELPPVWIDEDIFKQALINLIQNSIAAMDGKPGIITIQAYEKKGYIYFTVKDNGKGIPDAIQTKIFDPYFTTKPYGSGLGLTIVYKIIKEHSGEISFTSSPGETIFTIRLPISSNKNTLIEYIPKNPQEINT